MAEEQSTPAQAEDIEKIRDLQRAYARKTAQIGQIELERHALDKMKTQLLTEYDALDAQEQALIVELSGKYGDGVLDIESAAFIPSKSPDV